jgi:hypothetical protein
VCTQKIAWDLKKLIGSSQKLTWHVSLKNWMVMLSKVDRFRLKKLPGMVMLSKNCLGWLCSQKVDRILSKTNLSRFSQKMDRYHISLSVYSTFSWTNCCKRLNSHCTLACSMRFLKPQPSNGLTWFPSPDLAPGHLGKVLAYDN